MSIILAYIFYFIAASASPLQRRWLATNKNPENKGQIHFAFQVAFVTVVLSLLLPLFQPFHVQGSAVYLIGLSVICGIFGAAYFSSSYYAQKHVEAGVSTMVSNIYTPITIVLATLLLNEKLTGIQIFGTVLLLVGIVVVSKKHHLGRFKFDKYFMLMALSGVMLGVVLTAERALQKMTGFSAGTMLSWWSQCATLGIVTLLVRSKSQYSLKDISITGGLRYLQSLSYVILLFAVGNLSFVTAVTTFKVVILFFAGAVFLKEHDDLGRKILGSGIAVAGLLLMK
jgi:drug/metabolite transporter (DMT)-like permease